MFVVEVSTLRSPSARRLSAGRPVPGSVIATNEAQVSRAYRSRVARSSSAPCAPGASVSAATRIATPHAFLIGRGLTRWKRGVNRHEAGEGDGATLPERGSHVQIEA